MISSLFSLVTSSAVLYMLAGAILGLIFGAIPGLTATLAVVILIPLTYSLDAISGVAMLIGAYMGGISGGFVAAIMLNMPGTPSSITTTFDGFPLAKQGKAGKALGVGNTSNLVGSFIGWVFLLCLAPLLTKIALNFSAFEYTLALLFGFTAVIALSGKSPVKGLIAALFGLTLTLIGYDSVTGMPRATFGIKMIRGGISYMAVMIGVYVVAEVFSQIEEIAQKFIVPKQKITGVHMTFKEFKESIPNFIRSGIIGTFIGILPGIGGAFANFVTYDQARKASKNPDSFGKGNIQGVVASETGNNAVIGGALIPFISLGIPGDVVTAALLGGLMIQGINPGPLFTREHPDVVFVIYNAVLLSAILCFIIMQTVGIRAFPKALHIPKYILLPVVLIMALVGTYNMNFSVNDVWMAILFGLIGYLMDKAKIPKSPMVIAMILGQNFETYFRTAMLISNGSVAPFFTRPICIVLLVIICATIVLPIFTKKTKAGRMSAAADEGQTVTLDDITDDGQPAAEDEISANDAETPAEEDKTDN